MKIETKFSNGDKVWHIWDEREKKFITCSFCQGSGHIVGKDGKERICPECYGKGGQYEYFAMKWQVQTLLTIGQVRAEVTGEWEGSNDPGGIEWENYKARPHSYEEQYMCRETGIRSGTLYDGNNLFATKEEAQAECDKRNVEPEQPA